MASAEAVRAAARVKAAGAIAGARGGEGEGGKLLAQLPPPPHTTMVDVYIFLEHNYQHTPFTQLGAPQNCLHFGLFRNYYKNSISTTRLEPCISLRSLPFSIPNADLAREGFEEGGVPRLGRRVKKKKFYSVSQRLRWRVVEGRGVQGGGGWGT